MQRSKYLYPSVIIGAVLMMLLRICDKASILSVVFVIAGMTALVYSVRHASAKKEYLFIAGIIIVTFTVRFYGYIGNPVPDIILGILIGCVIFGLMGIERFVRKYEDCFWYTLIFPIVYFLFLYLTEALKIIMPFRLDTYFSCIPVLCQITSVLGVYILDFLLAWTASMIVYLIDFKESSGKIVVPAVIYAAVLCGVLCFGVVHMNQMNAQEAVKNDTVRVAYATGPYIGTLADDSYTELTMEETLNSFSKVVENAAKENAEILLFSEESYSVSDINENTLLDKAKEMAVANDMYLLLAYEVEDSDDSEEGKSINKLCWISNEGEVCYDYTKHCIIPFIETSKYVRGDKNIEPFDIDVHGKTLKVATAICYDSDFDLFMSHMGKHIDLLLLPTWDWDVIAEEHFGVARLRAISTETTVVRSVYDGWGAVIDSAGNVLARSNTNDVGYETVQFYDVPIK